MNIQQRRQQMGWTQEQLALHSGLSTRTIQRVERGEIVGAESLNCLAAVFDVPVSVIVAELHYNSMAHSETRDELEFKLNPLEQNSIEFARSILHSPPEHQNDPLTQTERNAVNSAKSFIKRLRS